jgi:uncharacterized protein YbjQ (UPF0145 family)
MASCTKCGAKMGFSLNNYCNDCIVEKGLLTANKRASNTEDTAVVKQIEAIMLTTETAPNLNITKRIEIVTAECAFGMNMFKDLFAGVRDIVGGRSKAVQETMRDARKTALYELKSEAHLVGANAVVGVDLDYVELSNSGSMVMLVASGTAVIIED